jgi:DNA-binding transcriptional regulator YiaG
MLLIAKKMEQALSASLIDDRQKELSDHQIEKIRQQLKLIQTHMTTRGIPSGSPVALRLFS